jgi:protein-S-isoprenylcysteine O-methyltransferase Ste14
VRAVEVVFGVCWAAFWLYWIVAAFSMKRGRRPWSRELRIRAVIFVVVIVLVRAGAFRGHGLHSDPLRAGIGLVLFLLGLGFAVWARLHIGRNWGTPMTQKNEPELVTSGPYRLVRHPIYSGIILGGAATAVALGWSWLVPTARRHLLRLQRRGRGAFPDGAVPGRLPGIPELDEDARPVRPLGHAR